MRNRRTSCALIALWSGLFCILLARPAWARIIDQEYTPDVTLGAFYEANAPLGQTFSPQTLTEMNLVQLQMSDDTIPGNSDSGAIFRVRIRQGDSLRPGAAGTILGVSEAAVLPDHFGMASTFGGGIVDFSFLQPISLVLNDAYTIELIRDSGDNFLLYGKQPGGYARGAGIDEGGDAAGVGDIQDFWFREGFVSTVIPEPTTLPLTLIGMTILLLRRRVTRPASTRKHQL